MTSELYKERCSFNSKALEYTANFYKILYFFGIFVPILLSAISFGFYPNIKLLPAIAFFLSFIPFMIFVNIPKIQKYQELSEKYHVLFMDFQHESSKNLLQEYEELSKELSKNNINFIIKYFLNKKKK
jgi:hypothetical protein